MDQYEVAKVLLQNNADKRIKDNMGKTALDYVKEKKNVPIIDLLID